MTKGHGHTIKMRPNRTMVDPETCLVTKEQFNKWLRVVREINLWALSSGTCSIVGYKLRLVTDDGSCAGTRLLTHVPDMCSFLSRIH